jgi:hypothetical protein
MAAPMTPGKPLKDMTRRELFLLLIWSTIVCGVPVVFGIRKLVSHQPGEPIWKPIIIIVCPLLLMSAVYVGAIQELKKRKRKQK